MLWILSDFSSAILNDDGDDRIWWLYIYISGLVGSNFARLVRNFQRASEDI